MSQRRSATLPPGAVLDVAAPAKHDADEIRETLLNQAIYYDFFHAVGMMERLSPKSVRVGGGGPYRAEFVRFRHDIGLGFKASDITAIAYTAKPKSAEDLLSPTEHRFEVTTSFIGLVGTTSPLPTFFAEEVVQSEDDEGGAIKRDFFDIIHHRIISFVYRIGVKYDFAREYMLDASDPWSRRILALAGFDYWAERRPRSIPTWQFLRLAPLLAHATRSARTIEVALEDVLEEALRGATVRVEQYAGDWSPLDEDQRLALGRHNHILGHDAVLGLQCYDRGGRAVIVISTLTDNFRRFLTDGDMFPVLVEVLRLLCDEPIMFELELVINESNRECLYLGQADGSRLGLDAWLVSEGSEVGDTRMNVEIPLTPPDPAPSTIHG